MITYIHGEIPKINNKNSNLIYKNEYAHVPLVYRKSHFEERKKSDIREREERKGRNGIT